MRNVTARARSSCRRKRGVLNQPTPTNKKPCTIPPIPTHTLLSNPSSRRREINQLLDENAALLRTLKDKEEEEEALAVSLEKLKVDKAEVRPRPVIGFGM